VTWREDGVGSRFPFSSVADRRKKNSSADNVSSARTAKKSRVPKKGEEERGRNRPMWSIVSDSLFFPRTKQKNWFQVSLICSSLMIFYSSRSFPSLSPPLPHRMRVSFGALLKRYTYQTRAALSRPVQTHRLSFRSRSERSLSSVVLVEEN
jgi:hypothetical protein